MYEDDSPSNFEGPDVVSYGEGQVQDRSQDG
jgi:hypothetical protein